MLTCTAMLTVQAGQEAEFERMLRAAVPKVREEPGNQAYMVHRSTQDPRVFMVYAAYDDQAALEAHQVHLRAIGIDLHAMLEGPPTVECYERLV